MTEKLPYGRDEALTFLNELMPAAPDVVVQVAHLAGAGPWEDEGSQQAFAVFAEAVANRDPRTRLLLFRCHALGAPATPETAQRWTAMIRQARDSACRVRLGCELATVTPGQAWVALRNLLPLTDDEFATIAANVPPTCSSAYTCRHFARRAASSSLWLPTTPFAWHRLRLSPISDSYCHGLRRRIAAPFVPVCNPVTSAVRRPSRFTYCRDRTERTSDTMNVRDPAFPTSGDQ